LGDANTFFAAFERLFPTEELERILAAHNPMSRRPLQISAAELLAGLVYAEGWEQELAYHELKVNLRASGDSPLASHIQVDSGAGLIRDVRLMTVGLRWKRVIVALFQSLFFFY
jgi:hypothetical protein